MQIRKFKRKSELSDAAKSYIEWAQKHGNASIVEFRSDNGGEFVEQSLQTYLDSNGIVWTPCTPYIKQQNGVSERTIQTLMRKIRAMLKQAGLGMNMWCYAADVAVYLTNKIGRASCRERV